MNHIAVVPVFSRDDGAAVKQATALTPHVVAICFTSDVPAVDAPLLFVDAPHESWPTRVERVVQTLKRTERPDRITLVLPEALAELFADSEVEVATV